MKKIIMLIALSAAVLVAKADVVISVVDISEVHKNYYKTKQAAEILKAGQDTANAEVQRMAEKLKAMIEEIKAIEERAKNPAMSEDAKKTMAEKEYAPKVNEARTLEQNIKNYQNQAIEKLRKQDQEVMMNHRKDIIEVIEKIAKEKKLDFVIEKGVCHFSKPASNITEDVISTLNANAPKN